MAAEIGFERYVEELNIDLAHIMADPFLEHVHQEASVLLGTHRALGHQVAGLRIEQALLAGPFAPALVCNADRLVGSTLDDWYELYPLGAQLVAEKAINVPAMLFVGGVDRAEDVKVDIMIAQGPPTLHHQIEGALPAPVATIRVMQFARPVHAQADQEVVLLEECAPIVVKQQPIGLESVLHDLPRAAVLRDQFDGTLEEGKLHQRRLAALPRYCYVGRAVRLEQLADVGIKRSFGHPALVVRV